jgi:hypothetical protein
VAIEDVRQRLLKSLSTKENQPSMKLACSEAWLVFTLAFSFSFAQEKSSGLFDFNQDMRVFTAHAFMNAAGNNGEWRKAGMHPVRTEIRKHLSDVLDSSYVRKLTEFASVDDRIAWPNWASFALLTDGPPNFKLAYEPKTTPYGEETEKRMRGLSPLLAEFYVKARIPQLWAQYLQQLQNFNDEFRSYAQKALDDIIEYCRLPHDYFAHRASRMHVVFSPLMSYFTAQTDQVNGEIYFIFGPQEGKPSPSSFYHEALHHVTGPLTEKYQKQTERLTVLFALADSSGGIGYSQVEESFVRTLDKVLQGRLFGQSDSTIRARVVDEYNLGFILCMAIYEQLPDYEASGLTFAEYYPTILSKIDVEKERKRWREHSADRGK